MGTGETISRKISAKYWCIASNNKRISFSEILEDIYSSGDFEARERVVESEFKIRLERFEKINNLYVGEVCRIQTENLPPSTGPKGLSPMNLPDGQGVGYRSTFVTDTAGENVLWHQDKLGCSPSKFKNYISKFGDPPYLVSATPFASGDMWKALGHSKHVRSFSVKVQPEADLSLLDDGNSAFMDLARNSVKAYHAKTIEFTVTADIKNGEHLDKKNTTGTLAQVMAFLGSSKVRATVENDDGPQILDFLNSNKSVRGDLDRYPKDIKEDWNSRKRFLVERYDSIINHGNSDTNNA